MQTDWINILIAPLAAAVVGFVVWYFQSRLEALRRERERLHDDRRKVYTDILEPFVLIFAGIKDPAENAKALKLMLSPKYKKAAFEFGFVGSDEVVKAFNALMQYVYQSSDDKHEADPRVLMQLYGELMLCIRRNVGDKGTKLTPADMLASQIKDIERFLAG